MAARTLLLVFVVLTALQSAARIGAIDSLGYNNSDEYDAAYREVFAYFSDKKPIVEVYTSNYTVGGLKDQFRIAYDKLRNVIPPYRAHFLSAVKKTLTPELQQGVNNARIARMKFLQRALSTGVKKIILPAIRCQAINLDKLNGIRGKRSDFEQFGYYYDTPFFKETSAHLEVTFEMSTFRQARENGMTMSSKIAWGLPEMPYACHPLRLDSKKDCLGQNHYAELSPLPIHLASESISNISDKIEAGLRRAALEITGSRRAAFVAVHLRLEKDWTKWHSSGICFNGSEIIRRVVTVARLEMCDNKLCPLVVYVMGSNYSDFDIVWPVNTRHFTKFDFIDSTYVNSDTKSALVDADIALRADMFVGTPRSGHSSMIFWDRHLLRKRNWRYERYTSKCEQYINRPMAEAESCDSPECACRYGAFRSACLNMHCLTVGICNYSFPAGKEKKRNTDKKVTNTFVSSSVPSPLHRKKSLGRVPGKQSVDNRVNNNKINAMDVRERYKIRKTSK